MPWTGHWYITFRNHALRLVKRLWPGSMRSAQSNLPPVYLYRYRPAKAVLDGFEELEKQEIYFSTTEELNDPMEGFKDLFWSGDEIVWRSLLKHYVFCLLDTTYHAFIMGTEFNPKHVEGVALASPDSLPDAPIKDIYKRLAEDFLKDPAIVAFLEAVSSRKEPVRRNELMGYLRALHPLIMTPIFNDLHSRGLWLGFVPPPDDQAETLRQNAIKLIKTMTKLPAKKKFRKRFSDAVFATAEAMYEQLQLIAEANMPARDKKAPIIFLSGDFPRAYLAALDKLVHSDWYVACFTNRPDNHSMWSTYADGHRGVCLMFKTPPNIAGESTLTLNRKTGMGGSRDGPTTYSFSFVPHETNPVRYSTDYPAIDFFRSLGRIRQMDMNNFWYRGDNGKFSVCKDAVYEDEEAWRKSYWQTFGSSTLYKTPEWSHEEEYRVVVHSFFDLSKKEDRKLRYKFEDLAGIVFGARATTETKLKIMHIINKKCGEVGRNDFKFFEVRYAPDTSFKVHELSLLKIQHPVPPSEIAR